MMQEQTIKKSDARIGVPCNVAIHKSKNIHYTKANLYDEKFANLNKNDIVYVLTPSEHQQILENETKMKEYIARINQLELEINETNLRKLKQENEDYKNTIANRNKSIATYKTNKVKSDARIQQLEKQVEDLTSEHEKLEHDLQKQNKINDNNETIITNLKSRIDELGKELDESSSNNGDASDEDEVAQLKDELEKSQKQVDYLKHTYEKLIDSSDELANANEKYKHENEKLRNDNNAINETNKLLNENLIASNNTFKETKQELQSTFESKELELKETIKKQQSHIDETTQKYESLLPLKEHVAQKEHYEQLSALKDEIKQLELEKDKSDNEIESKLASQKSDLEIQHANEKAQMLVGYNQELNKLKLEYNNLANEYNYLLNEVDSITKWNALFDSRHEKIRKDKEQVPLLEIPSDQLPQSNVEIPMEKYVPQKDEVNME